MSGFMESMGGSTTMKAQIEEEIGEEVKAAAELSQGKPPSMFAMVTGAALIELVRRRRSKALPKRFLLAVTSDRVIALRGAALSDEDGNDRGAIVRGEFGSWPRNEVSVAAAPGEEGKAFTLEVAGERVPVFNPNLNGDPETAELARLLSR